MRIKNIDITAFGGVKDLHIKADDGLNVIYGENGSGKSTVMDFIKAVFYGIGRGKERNGRLPWDGTKASGSVVYSNSGGEFLCQTSFGKTARGDRCEIFNNVTGELINGEPVGSEVFSMSDVTFSKTAFISSNGAKVEQKGDDEIAEKLSNLKESGDEGVSFSAAAADVDSYMAKLIAKRGQGGRIQQLDNSIEELKAELYHAERMISDGLDIKKELDDVKAKKQQAEQEIEFLKKAEAVSDFRYCRSKKLQLEELSEPADTEEMKKYAEEISRIASEIASVDSRLAEISEVLPEKEKISEQTFADITELYYSKNSKPKKAPFVLMLTLAAAFAALGFVNPFFFIGTAVFLLLAVVYRPKAVQSDALSDALSMYGESDYEAFRARFMEQERYEALKKSNQETRERLTAEGERLSALLEDAKARANQAFGDWKNIDNLINESNSIRERRAVLASSLETALRGRSYEQLEKLYGSETFEIPENLSEKIKAAEVLFSEYSSKIASLERRGGVLEGSGCDICELERRIAELSERRDELRFNYNVLSTVLTVLNESYEVMEGEFGERLNVTAGRILSGIAGYDTARMSRDFGVKLTENGEIHDLSEFSTGLFEQTYLSFRLAMLELMESGCPVFLDDCLMSYDDSRAEKMLAYLKEFSKDRQVFLFTCRSRDLLLAESLGANCVNI